MKTKTYQAMCMAYQTGNMAEAILLAGRLKALGLADKSKMKDVLHILAQAPSDG